MYHFIHHLWNKNIFNFRGPKKKQNLNRNLHRSITPKYPNTWNSTAKKHPIIGPWTQISTINHPLNTTPYPPTPTHRRVYQTIMCTFRAVTVGISRSPPVILNGTHSQSVHILCRESLPLVLCIFAHVCVCAKRRARSTSVFHIVFPLKSAA